MIHNFILCCGQMVNICFGENAYHFLISLIWFCRWSGPIAKLGTGSLVSFKPSKTDWGELNWRKIIYINSQNMYVHKISHFPRVIIVILFIGIYSCGPRAERNKGFSLEARHWKYINVKTRSKRCSRKICSCSWWVQSMNIHVGIPDCLVIPNTVRIRNSLKVWDSWSWQIWWWESFFNKKRKEQ